METDTLLDQREKTHGRFEENALVSQQMQSILQWSFGWSRLSNVQREALQFICHKIGRILSGSADFPDHWADIAGYARLAEKSCKPCE